MFLKYLIPKFIRVIDFKSWFLIIILTLLLIVIVRELAGTVINAYRNYNVYVAEQAGLEELQTEYAVLERELEYYRSYEFKKLYARDNLNLTQNGETLYRIEDENQFFEVGRIDLDYLEDNRYTTWWQAILF